MIFKEMWTVKSLKQAITPVVWLNCIFCMGVFEIPLNHPRYFLSAFYVISILTGYFIMLYKGFFIIQVILRDENTYITIFYIFLGINVIVAVLAIILFWKKSESLNIVIKRTSIVDNTLEALGIKKEYEKTFRNILYFVAIWTMGSIMIISTNILCEFRDIGYWYAIYHTICLCFPVIINSVVDLTFVSLIRCVHIKFQKTNTVINNIMLWVNESNVKIHNQHDNMPVAFIMRGYKNHKDKIMHIMQTVRHLHLEITRIAQQINCIYCLQLLLEMAVHFTAVTSTVYCIYGALFGRSRMISSEKDAVLLIWACIYSIKIILVNWLCTSVSTEAYKTGEIIQSLEEYVVDDDLREEIQQFTQQIVLNSLKITAFDFFTIDNSLTGKFFATVTTYVVILIQMNPAPT